MNVGASELLIIVMILALTLVPVVIIIVVIGGASRRRQSGTAAWTGVAPTTPPGWHPDPVSRQELRWWDGNRWTESVSDQGIIDTDPI